MRGWQLKLHLHGGKWQISMKKNYLVLDNIFGPKNFHSPNYPKSKPIFVYFYKLLNFLIDKTLLIPIFQIFLLLRWQKRNVFSDIAFLLLIWSKKRRHNILKFLLNIGIEIFL